jgi:hypothetical protein
MKKIKLMGAYKKESNPNEENSDPKSSFLTPSSHYKELLHECINSYLHKRFK